MIFICRSCMCAKSAGVNLQRTSTRRRTTPVLVHGASTRTRCCIHLEQFWSSNSQQINARVDWRRQIIPVAQLLCVLRAKVLLPSFDEKLRVRRSNEQWPRVSARNHLSPPARRSAQHGVYYRPLL